MTRNRGNAETSDRGPSATAELTLILPRDRPLRWQLATGAISTVAGIALSVLKHEFAGGLLVVLGLGLMAVSIHRLGRSGT